MPRKFLFHHGNCNGGSKSRHGEALIEVAMLFNKAVSRKGFAESVRTSIMEKFPLPRNHIRPFWIVTLGWCLLRVQLGHVG
jgi:hypothetical protein